MTRDGILRRRAPGYESLLNTPGATIAIGESTVRRQWLAVETKSSGWALQVYDCDTLSQPGIRAEPTPLYVLDYARISGRTDFYSCGKSGRAKTAMLGG